MSRTPKLNDLQLILLAAAAQRDDGVLLPPANTPADQEARVRKAVPSLVKRKLVDEIDVSEPALAWRSEDDCHTGMIITAAGRAAIADEDAALGFGDSAPAAGEPDVSASRRPTSKIAHVLALLQREQGATLDELVAATGWLPHTTRAALTGLRKKGHVLDKALRDGSTCYRIAAA